MGLDNPLHIAFLVVILLLVFGARRLPEIGRSLGSGMREFKTSVTGELNHNNTAAQPQQTLPPGAQPQPQAQPPLQPQPQAQLSPQPQAQPQAQPVSPPAQPQPPAEPQPVAQPTPQQASQQQAAQAFGATQPEQQPGSSG